MLKRAEDFSFRSFVSSVLASLPRIPLLCPRWAGLRCEERQRGEETRRAIYRMKSTLCLLSPCVPLCLCQFVCVVFLSSSCAVSSVFPGFSLLDFWFLLLGVLFFWIFGFPHLVPVSLCCSCFLFFLD